MSREAHVRLLWEPGGAIPTTGGVTMKGSAAAPPPAASLSRFKGASRRFAMAFGHP